MDKGGRMNTGLERGTKKTDARPGTRLLIKIYSLLWFGDGDGSAVAVTLRVVIARSLIGIATG
jgi:hypothetical protein